MLSPRGISKVGSPCIMIKYSSPDWSRIALEHIQNRAVLPRRGMDENGTVVIPLGNLDMQIGVILNMQHLLMAAHLIPLCILPLRGVDAPERLHCQKKLQFKMWDVAGKRLTPKRTDKTVPVRS